MRALQRVCSKTALSTISIISQLGRIGNILVEWYLQRAFWTCKGHCPSVSILQLRRLSFPVLICEVPWTQEEWDGRG